MFTNSRNGSPFGDFPKGHWFSRYDETTNDFEYIEMVEFEDLLHSSISEALLQKIKGECVSYLVTFIGESPRHRLMIPRERLMEIITEVRV